MPLIIEIMYSVKVKKYLIPSLTRRCVKPMLTRYTDFRTINQFELVFRSNKWFYLMDCFMTQLNVCVNNLLFIIKLIFSRPRTSAWCQIKANEQEFPPNFTSSPVQPLIVWWMRSWNSDNWLISLWGRQIFWRRTPSV